MVEETRYICPCCGEEIITPVDLSQGEHQEYVEDCPICCRPVVLQIELDGRGGVDCQAYPE